MPDTNRVRGRLSDAEKAAIEDLADRGLNAGQIARRLNRLPGTINFAMVTSGLRAPVVRIFAYRRGSHEVRSFSPLEDALIEALRCQRYTLGQIADVVEQRFGYRRSKSTIGIRLRMLSSREVCAEPQPARRTG